MLMCHAQSQKKKKIELTPVSPEIYKRNPKPQKCNKKRNRVERDRELELLRKPVDQKQGKSLVVESQMKRRIAK